MPITREKRLWPKIVYSKITLVLVLMVSAVLAMSVYERFTIEREMAERRRSAETELRELSERKRELESKVEYLSAEHGIEAEIRKHFDVAREGERVVVIVDGQEAADSASAAVILGAEPDTGASIWSRLIPW